MPENKELKVIVDAFEMKAIADACIDSTRRSRYVIIVIVFTSILAFIGFWNARGSAWIDCRLDIAKKTYLLKEIEKYKLEGNSTYTKNDSVCTQHDRDWFLKMDAVMSKVDISQKEAEDFFKNRKFVTPNGLEKYIEDLERLLTEKVLNIQVPILGVVFDVNDLGLFAGIAFSIILLWFRFTLWRELTNLKIVFQEAKKRGQLATYYHYLAMHQVLTIPQSIPVTLGKSKEKFWNKVQLVLFFLPLIVQLTTISWDLWSTYVKLTITDLLYSPILLQAEYLLVVPVVILTINCLKLAKESDNEWDEAFHGVLNELKILNIKDGIDKENIEDK